MSIVFESCKSIVISRSLLIQPGIDLPMTAEAEKIMGDYVSDHPRGQHGSHEYDLASYGLDPDQVRERLQWYIDRFDLDA